MSPERILVTFFKVPAVAIKVLFKAKGEILVTDFCLLSLVITRNLDQFGFVLFIFIFITFLFLP